MSEFIRHLFGFENLEDQILKEAEKCYIAGEDMPTLMVYVTPYGDVDIEFRKKDSLQEAREATERLKAHLEDRYASG